MLRKLGVFGPASTLIKVSVYRSQVNINFTLEVRKRWAFSIDLLDREELDRRAVQAKHSDPGKPVTIRTIR